MLVRQLVLSILLAVAGLGMFGGLPVQPAWSAGASRFDGIWNVTVACAHAPDGALPYSWVLSAEIRGGNLLGYYQKPGMVPSGTLSGHIDEAGDALLVMQGLTGNSSYTVGRVTPGTSFHYTVTSHFDATHGFGKRNELRHCDLDFVRQ